MKIIMHLSDIHFGKTDAAVIAALSRAAFRLRPDLVVISGDLTQRARIIEFAEAADFIRALTVRGLRVVAIPGNHDIRPWSALLKRARHPFDRYDELIGPFVLSCAADKDIALSSMNTVRAARIKGGSVASKDIRKAAAWFSENNAPVKIIVTHHPLDLPAASPNRKLAKKAKRGIYELSNSKIDIYLSGHYHRSSAVPTSIRYDEKHHAALAIQAGTVSTRSRGETQSFNILEISKDRIAVTTHCWNPARASFAPGKPQQFEKKNGWKLRS